MKFHWEWCEFCDAPFIRCPKCNNNSCNAGYGEIDGVKCDVCPMAYQFQHLACKTGNFPKREMDIEYYNKKILK